MTDKYLDEVATRGFFVHNITEVIFQGVKNYQSCFYFYLAKAAKDTPHIFYSPNHI